MARGFGSGVLWGLVVTVAGLATWSQLAPRPVAVEPAPEAVPAPVEPAAEVPEAADGAPVADLAEAPKEAPAAEPPAEAPKVEEPAAVAEAPKAEEPSPVEEAPKPEEPAPVAEQPKAAEPVEAEPAPAATGTDGAKAAAEEAPVEAAGDKAPEAPQAAPAAPAEAPALPEAAALPGDQEAPSLTGLDQALIAPESEASPGPQEAAPPAPEAPGDVLLQPGQPAGLPEPERLPQIAPPEEAELAPAAPPAAPEPAAEAAPAPAEPAPAPPEEAGAEEAATLPPAPPLQDKLPTTVMDKTVPGVKVGELPQVGVEPKAAPAPQAEAEATSAFLRYSRPFQPEGKPLFAILLRDIGPQGMARADLASLPFPVSVVIDPLAPDAAEAMAAWRAVGQEVVMLANGLPQGATAADVETTFATLEKMLPESVAVIDQDLGGFQDDRLLATLVLPVIEGQGRGLLTWDRGLNAADQIARREGVPSATIFRRLDAEGESRTTIRRYLDRAAFKAAQEGAVVVIGDTRPETVAAILEWTVEGKAGTVSLAPVTAVMGR